jgi:hypothetical protein
LEARQRNQHSASDQQRRQRNQPCHSVSLQLADCLEVPRRQLAVGSSDHRSRLEDYLVVEAHRSVEETRRCRLDSRRREEFSAGELGFWSKFEEFREVLIENCGNS